MRNLIEAGVLGQACTELHTTAPIRKTNRIRYLKVSSTGAHHTPLEGKRPLLKYVSRIHPSIQLHGCARLNCTLQRNYVKYITVPLTDRGSPYPIASETMSPGCGSQSGLPNPSLCTTVWMCMHIALPTTTDVILMRSESVSLVSVQKHHCINE